MPKVVVEIGDVIDQFMEYDAEIKRLREALQNIACSCDTDCECSPLGLSPATMNCDRYRARAALGEKE